MGRKAIDSDALSLDGDRLAVGASGSNSAYIFEQNADGSWSQVTKILSLDGRPGDRFGGSLSLDGDRVAVGAYGDDFNGSSSGSAYIFERDAGGSWSQVAKILPLDGRPGDDFGEAVSLDGDRLAVGAAGNDDNGSGSGSAYIFERNADGIWSPVTKILPLDGQAGDDFGEAVSLDDDRLAVGAQDDDDNGSDSGSAYIFERNEDGNWPPVTKILPLDGQASDAFGDSVSLDGDRLAVGAFFGNADNGLDSGSAYIFERNPDGSWSQVSEIFPLDGQVSDFFGDSVSLDGDRLAVGASGDADNGPDTGSAYIFDSVLVSPQLSIAGTCPGEITLISGGNTPRSGVSLYHSANVGTFSLGVGACDGTEIELDAPDLLRSDAVGFDPGFTRVRAVDEFWCGRFLQLIDERTCLTSEVVQVP